jgi:uncharacterized protein (DUF983 family)
MLRCNECDAQVGVVAVEILKALLGIGSLHLTCPACGHDNTFPGFSSILVARCSNCDAAIEMKTGTPNVQ